MLQERWLVFSDVHGPFNDPRFIDEKGQGLILDIAEDIDVTHILLNGDILDFYWFGAYAKSAYVLTRLEDEIEWGVEFFKNLRKRFPKQKIVFNAGNHEDRLDRFMQSKGCPLPFQDRLRLDILLQLERYDIEWYRYNNAYHIPGTGVVVQHSPPSYGQNAARTSLLKKLVGSYIFGCAHRPDSAYLSSYDGRRHECHVLGWLGSTDLTEDHKEVFSYTKGHDSWGNSFATLDVVGKEYFIQHHIIKDYKTVVNGALYEG